MAKVESEGSVYRRKGTRYFWMKWRDRHRQWHRASTEVETEAEALEVLAAVEERERAVKTELTTRTGLKVAAPTVQSFCDEAWLPLRKRSERGRFAWISDQSHLEHHFMP